VSQMGEPLTGQLEGPAAGGQAFIRATVISPGAVATELPDSVTEPDIAEYVRKLDEIALPTHSFADAVIFAMSQPEDMDVDEFLFRPTGQQP
jgi:NADP-dependent 3-hydroxy acid dehydrogenase YdfG